MLQVNRHTVYRWAREGKIRALYVGSTWRIPEDAIDELILSPSGEKDD
jgi:excisionase family DNA binding protein